MAHTVQLTSPHAPRAGSLTTLKNLKGSDVNVEPGRMHMVDVIPMYRENCSLTVTVLRSVSSLRC